MVQTPKLNLTKLFENSSTGGSLYININKEGDSIVIGVNSTIVDNSASPLSSNVNTNGRYVFSGTPEEIELKIVEDLGLSSFVAVQ